MAKKPPSNGVAPDRDAPEAEPTLPLETTAEAPEALEAPEAPATPAEPKVGKVRLTTQIKQDEVIDLEPEAGVPPPAKAGAAPAAATPPPPPAAQPAKPDKLKPWRMADGKLDEDKFIAETEHFVGAGREIVDLMNGEPEVRKAVWAAQKKRGVKLAPEIEAELAPPKPVGPADLTVPNPKLEGVPQAQVEAEYVKLYQQGQPAKAELLMHKWVVANDPEVVEAKRVAADMKARTEADTKAKTEAQADAALRAEFATAAKKFDGVLAVEGNEVVWTDAEVMEDFNDLAKRYPAAPVEELLQWSLSRKGRLQVEPEPTNRPTPRLTSRAAPGPAKKKLEPGKVSLRVSVPSLRVEGDDE